MKRKVLAAILVVTMILSIFIGCIVRASGFDGAIVVVSNTFDDDSELDGIGSIKEDTISNSGKVYCFPEGHSASKVYSGFDPSKTYTMIYRAAGTYADLGIQEEGAVNVHYGFYKMDDTYDYMLGLTGKNAKYTYTNYWPGNLAWVYCTASFTGVTKFKFAGQNQGEYENMSNKDRFMDDILILEGNYVALCEAWIADNTQPNPYDLVNEGKSEPVKTPGDINEPTATPTPAATTDPTAAVTVTPSSTATVAPSASATVDTGKTDDNGTTAAKKSVKFKKNKVTIKKGKKATLKVTIEGAKKAQFSVNKKGKKFVKLSKKKAKSVVVTGKKKGKATITAKAAGKKATCKVTVK